MRATLNYSLKETRQINQFIPGVDGSEAKFCFHDSFNNIGQLGSMEPRSVVAWGTREATAGCVI